MSIVHTLGMFYLISLTCIFTATVSTSGVDFNISAEGDDFVSWPSPWGQLLKQINGTMVFNTVCSALYNFQK